MTFDCAVTREMGEDPIPVCKFLGQRDCINHVHIRNVRVRKPLCELDIDRKLGIRNQCPGGGGFRRGNL